MIDPRISGQLDELLSQASKLREQYEHDITEGKSFEEVKTIYLEFKKVLQQIERLEIIASNAENSAN